MKTPEERQRRIEEIPEIHADPNMDPSHESEDEDEADDKRRGCCCVCFFQFTFLYHQPANIIIICCMQKPTPCQEAQALAGERGSQFLLEKEVHI